MNRVTGDCRQLRTIAPSGWDVFRLDEVAVRGTGHTPDKEVPEYWDGEVSWISLTDCHRLDKVFISETTKTITQKGIDNSSAVLHPGGVVVMSRDAGVGQSGVTTRPMAVSQHFVVWKCGDKLHNLYLYYWLQLLKPEFERIANGSTIKTIGMPYFAKLGVMFPAKAEQLRVATILQRSDQRLALLETVIERCTRLKQGLRRQLLTGTRRFTEFVRQKGTHHTPCGNLPRDWPLVPLHKVFSPVKRRNGAKTERVLTASGEHGMVDQRDFFNRSVAGRSIEDYYLLRRGEFAYNRSLMNGYPFGAIKRLDLYEEGALSTLYLCFALNRKDCDSDFLVHFFESGLLNGQLRGIAQMGARAHGLLNVPASDFFAMSMPLPNLEEQQKIASTLNLLDREICLLRQQHALLADQKKGLMQKLLTGQVRVRIDR